MILPTKHLRPNRCLLAVASEVLAFLSEPKTVSRLWDEFSTSRNRKSGRSPMAYEWFVLSLDLLFILGAVNFNRGRLSRSVT